MSRKKSRIRESWIYPRLTTEMDALGITAKWIAKQAFINYVGMLYRLKGKTAITVGEAIRIKRIMGSDLPIEELFERVDGL